MEKVNKQKLLDSLANSKGSQVMVPPTMTVVPAPALVPTLVSKTSVPAPEVDQLMDFAATLTMDESTPPSVSTKGAQYDSLQSPGIRVL